MEGRETAGKGGVSRDGKAKEGEHYKKEVVTNATCSWLAATQRG